MAACRQSIVKGKESNDGHELVAPKPCQFATRNKELEAMAAVS